MKKGALIIGAVFGLLAVLLGAFGAHALKAYLLESDRLDAYNTAVDYLFVHAIVLLIIGGVNWGESNSLSKYTVPLFVLGVLLFSGSLFVICMLDMSSIGFVTPVGGVFFVMGWVSLIVSFIKMKV